MQEAESAMRVMSDEKSDGKSDGISASKISTPRRPDRSDVLSQISHLNDGGLVAAAGDDDAGADNTDRGRGSAGGHPGGNIGDRETAGGHSGDWGDTGSLLTHGSSVVLAGNMAAAMRQRKRQTQGITRADGEDTTPSTPSSRSNSTGVKSRSSSIVSRDDDGAASVLDLAIYAEKRLSLHNSRGIGSGNGSGNDLSSTNSNNNTNSKSNSDLENIACGMGIAFLGDGDVTHIEADRGESIMHWNALENAGGLTSRGSTSLFLFVDEDDQIGDYLSQPCTPPRPASKGKTAGMKLLNASLLSLAKDMRENWGKHNVDSSSNSMRDSAGCSALGSARDSARGSAIGSARDSLRDSARGSADFSEGMSRNEYRDERYHSLDNRSRDSPRQHNVSANRSRAGSLTGVTVRAPSASFKVAVDGLNLADLKTRVPAKKSSDNWSRGRGAVFGDLTGAFDKDATGLSQGVLGSDSATSGVAARAGGRRRVFVEADEDVSTDSEVTDRRLGKGKGSYGVIAPRSIVHRDLVQRHFSPCNSPSPSPSPSYSEKSGATDDRDIMIDKNKDRDGTYLIDIDTMNGDSDDDSGTYEPYTAVAHATRHRLMSSSTRRKPSSPVPGLDGNRVLLGAALSSNRHYLPYVKSPTTVSTAGRRSRVGSTCGENNSGALNSAVHARAISALLGPEKEKAARTMSSRVRTHFFLIFKS